MTEGLQRAPVDVSGRCATDASYGRESVVAYREIVRHCDQATQLLRLDKENPYRATESDIEARRSYLEESKNAQHVNGRRISDLAIFVMATVSQFEEEFAGKDLLDIGCGVGRAGEALARQAKTKVTFLDTDETALSRVGSKSGVRVRADGRDLPFVDEAFDCTLASVSTIPWSVTPAESVQSLNEALRVVAVGGTSVLIPVFSHILERRKLPKRQLEDPEAKVWALQDHALLKSMQRYMREGYCSVSWTGYVFSGRNTGASIDYFSAIVDKEAHIPGEVLDEQLQYAKSLEQD